MRLAPGPDPIKTCQRKILLYAGIRPITEAEKGHVTNVIGRNSSGESNSMLEFCL